VGRARLPDQGVRGTAESIRPPSDGGELGRSRDTEFYCLCDLLTSEKRAISRPGAHVLLSRRLADTQAFGVPGDRGCLWLRLWGALGTGRFNIGVVR
jgi:hypothetical protein